MDKFADRATELLNEILKLSEEIIELSECVQEGDVRELEKLVGKAEERLRENLGD